MTSNEPARFSVLVACYGHERYLTEAIESLWAQSYRQFEIIAVDDGSPDGTGALLDHLSVRSPVPMQVVHIANAGAANAYNLAASRAGGEYLALLNDDDTYDPQRLEVFAHATELGAGAFWGFSAVQAINSRGEPIDAATLGDTPGPQLLASTRPIDALRSLPRFTTFVSSGNLVLSSELFRRLGGFLPYTHIHDWDLALRLLWNVEPSIMERRLYRYRIHDSNSFDASAAPVEVQQMWESKRLALRDELEALRQRVSEERDQLFAGRGDAGTRLRELEASRGWRYITRYRAIRRRILGR